MRGLSILGHLMILGCFLLPFLTVSCQGQKVTTLTGFDLVVRKKSNQDDFGQRIKRNQHLSRWLLPQQCV